MQGAANKMLLSGEGSVADLHLIARKNVACICQGNGPQV